jgi:hypothetical protein
VFGGGKCQQTHDGAARPADVVSHLGGYGYAPREINRDGSLGNWLTVESVSDLKLTTNVAFVKSGNR